jgi:hypothetical protein
MKSLKIFRHEVFNKNVFGTRFLIRGIALISPLFLLASCFGLSMDISLNQNGSGTLELEYQISKTLESLGKLDGNERWFTIPVGRADFERTMDRLPEMKLLSHSSKETEDNLIISAKMEFENLRALMAFIDAGGRRSLMTGDERHGMIALVLSDGSGEHGSLRELLTGISKHYFLKLSMSFPNEGNLKILNAKGLSLPEIPGSVITPYGRKVSCSFPMDSVLLSHEGINLEFAW